MKKKIINILLIGGALALFFLPLFVKVKLECKSQLGDCPIELRTKLKTLNTKNLFSAKKTASNILKTDYMVSNFSMQLKLPNILFVNAVVKKPIYAVLDKTQNKYLLIGGDSTVLSSSDTTDLPYIIKENVTEKSGDKISDKDLFALKLVEGVNQMYQVRTGLTQNDTLVVDLMHGIRVILPLEGDIQVLLGSLRLIYTKVTTNYLGVYSQIDMRFKNPIIR